MNTIITASELQPLIHNCLYSRVEEDGFLHTYCFTKKQEERYIYDSAVRGIDYIGRSFLSSSVTLDFITDAQFVGIDFVCKKGTDAQFQFLSIDCCVDGVLYEHLYTPKLSTKYHAFHIPDGKHHVQIFFPFCHTILLRDIIVNSGALVEPSPQKSLRILALGDSITQGYVTVHPSLSYINCLVRNFNAEVLNQAIGGYWFQGESLDKQLSEWKPDIIISAYGTNDYGKNESEDDFRSGVEGFCKALKSIFPDTKILGILPIWRGDDRHISACLMRNYSYKTAIDIIRNEYTKNPNITILEDNFFPRHPDFFVSDRIHPNDMGFLIYGENVSNVLRRIIHN